MLNDRSVRKAVLCPGSGFSVPVVGDTVQVKISSDSFAATIVDVEVVEKEERSEGAFAAGGTTSTDGRPHADTLSAWVSTMRKGETFTAAPGSP